MRTQGATLAAETDQTIAELLRDAGDTVSVAHDRGTTLASIAAIAGMPGETLLARCAGGAHQTLYPARAIRHDSIYRQDCAVRRA